MYLFIILLIPLKLYRNSLSLSLLLVQVRYGMVWYSTVQSLWGVVIVYSFTYIVYTGH
jgi:hypothetical protein